MSPSRYLVLAAAVLALAVGAEPAAAAPPQLLGQTPGSTAGGCTLCTAVQLTNSASPFSYVIPDDGVLTKARFYVGPTTEATDFAQARAFRKTGGSGATVAGEGAKHSLSGLSAGLHEFFERIPVSAGDVLGARFDSTPNVNGTPHVFATASGLDEAGTTVFPVDPEVGDSFTTSAFTSLRVNVRALYEPDEDHDGYGDTSQDLCPGSPFGATACSGALFGSDLQGAFTQAGVDCTYACLRVQTSVGGASTAVPFDGVVVRWRLLSAPPGAYSVRVLSPTEGPSHKITALSPSESVADPGSLSKITTFPARLPIPAGGYVGLVPPTFTSQPYREPTPGSKYVQVNDGPEGNAANLSGVGLTREILYNADIEPDVDRDGYGDLSQDLCPTQPASQGECSMVTPLATIPAIRDFRAKPKRFRVKLRGAVVSRRRAPAGTSLKLSLSERASVSFLVEKRSTCGKTATPKSCRPWKRVHSFTRQLGAGTSSTAYSGRYRKRGQVRTLSAGAYRVGAVATNAAGRSSATALASITVVP